MADANVTQATGGAAQQLSGSSSVPGKYDPKEQKQVFMEMLVAQMQNQSPTNPMDTNKMTSQMAQLNSVEQQVKTNELLQQLVSSRQGQNQVQAASLLGRSAWVEGSGLRVDDGQSSANYRVNLEESRNVRVSIADSNGQEVHSETLGELSAGTHEFSWDGKLSTGEAAPAGEYQVRVTEVGEQNPQPLPTHVQRTIEEVRFADGGTKVSLGGDQLIDFDALTAVSA